MNGYVWVVLTLLVALLVVNVWYCVEKIWELNRRHQRHLEEVNHEFKTQTQMLKNLTLPMMNGDVE